MLLAALGALSSFVGAIGTTFSADPATQVVESWRMWGVLVFGGLFALLALRPRRSPGVWELVILHKAATAATLVAGGVADALTVALVDGALAIMTVVSYLLARGYSGWVGTRLD